ncbi:hypothetical protein D7X30_20850 [Corallococcus sp. AB011P]|uniref:hypothetical protein n=1 Tax=unclassified Corallococcus TaxID=2685029 RepID=UPI000EA0E2A0|nr:MULTISPECIES: hypothetical protein [unclassified Corallococcus]RKG57190.1 hypothetical protein D7X30_20850 [Corallococcus sp. AB011P]RKH89540.1 hypothetical protein D7Y21_10380 [Corallococcus sp. AB045]
MPPVNPHFPVPNAVAVGDFLLDSWSNVAQDNNIRFLLVQVTNAQENRCIKHLDSYNEYQLCILALLNAFNTGAAPTNVANNHRYEHVVLNGTRYEFVYRVDGQYIPPPDNVNIRVANLWAIHRYAPGKNKAGAGSKNLHHQKMMERFFRDGGGGGGSTVK